MARLLSRGGHRAQFLAVGALTAGAATQLLRQRKMHASTASKAETYEYDLFTIGGGSGGVRATRWSASQYGAKAAVAELPFALVSEKHSAGGLGGTCVLRGCVPKKLLIYGSHLHEDLADAAGYGWSLPGKPQIDWGRLIAAKNAEVTRLNGIYRGLLDSAHIDVYEGYARIVDPHTVEVNGKRHTTRYICVATGSRAVVLPVPGSDLPGVITSDEALALPRRPDKLVVLGGGYIAVEFAGFFHGYGTEVHLVFRSDKPLRGFDEDVRSHLLELLEARGIHVHAGENPLSIEESSNNGKLCFRTDKGTVLEVDNVMFATGRKPNTADLGLQDAGVELAPKSGEVVVDEYSKSSVDSIYAVGDVTDRMNLTPVALMEGMALAQTLFGGVPTKPDYDGVPSAVFSQPPVGTCGLTEAAAAKKYGSVDVYISKFNPMKHTMPTGRKEQERTMMKMLVVSAGFKGAGRVVGVHMVGADAAEMMQGLGIAMKAGATKAEFDATVGIHPTAAEEWCTMRSKTRTTTAADAARSRL